MPTLPTLKGKPMSPVVRDTRLWHTLPEDQVLTELQVTLEGLTGHEAAQRQQRYGRNELPAAKPVTLRDVILHQFKSPLIYILLLAGVVSIAIGDSKDAIFIFAVVLLNAALGTVQEWRAEQSAAGLQRLLKIMARVRRAGLDQTIAAEDLTPGDIVLLESGDKVPADLCLLKANNLTIDESFLTGESIAATKNTARLAMAEMPIGDRANLAYAGSTVMSGRGLGVVIAIGLQTEIGQIAEVTTLSEATRPPLVIRMEKFVRTISVVVLGAAGLLAALALAQGTPLAEVFFFAIAMAVSAIPEGLPIAMTVALSIAVNRMAKRNVIVRKMTAVEALGSCTLIASDKTGTLTLNRQTVKVIASPTGERFLVSGEGYAGEGAITTAAGEAVSSQVRSRLEAVAHAAALCNEGTLHTWDGEWVYSGDSVDVALLALAYKAGLEPDALRRTTNFVAEIPFESERKFAAKAYQSAGRMHVAVKGAVETVLTFCETALTGEGASTIDRAAIETAAHHLAAEGYRVIAVARGELNGSIKAATFDESQLPPLTLLGLIGMIDPLRPEAKAAVDTCRQAGVGVVMITGDHPATALAIAGELGIAGSPDDLLVGRDLPQVDSGNDPTFVDRVKDAHVFARVTPLQKLHIVQALGRLGHFVAVTGDGVNDAPALRAANIGVAMGSGTDIAKDTASILVTDDNFASIVEGVREGRHAYDNVRKVIYLLISTGAAEILFFMLAIVAGLPIPLLPVQILWLNLVTNGIQDVALAFEGGEPGAMRRAPRRPTEGIFNRLMVQQVALSGATMGLVVFGVWSWLLHAGWTEAAARNLVLLLMVLFQNFHVFNCRSERESVFRVPLQRNRVLVFGVAAALGLQLLSMNLPFMQSMLHIAPVSGGEFVVLALIASLVMIVMEVFKWLKRERNQS